MDKRNLFIIVLGVALVLSFIFRPSKGIESYEDEIKSLRIENEKLNKNNDSLLIINNTLSAEIKDLMNNIDSTQAALANTNDKINNLQDDKDEVSIYVNTLNADGVASELTKYLNKRR